MKTVSTAIPISKTPTSRRRFVRLLALVVLAWAVVAGACATGSRLLPQQPAEPSGRPILILVSLDGWRWDYLDRAQVPRLRSLARAGVRSEGLIPPFPSKTFPSHYTIVTGLYPEHHGIVSNNMIDVAIGERFSMSAPTAKDTRWWGGEPLWITAQRQGQIAASMFWPGSDVEIDGGWPTYFKPFDDGFPNRQRVQQVIDWLGVPEPQRPSFLTLYFSDVDSAGHTYGPDSPEVLTAAARLDREIGALVDGVNALHLNAAVHYVFVSDHGMSATSLDRLIVLDDYLDPSTLNVIDWTPVAGFWPRNGSADDIYLALKGKHPAMTVYRREEVPAALHFSSNPRIPPVIAIADDGWTITSKAQADTWGHGGRPLGGNHGFDPRLRSMHGLFIAVGPQFRQGATVPPFESVHLYDMMARVLGLTPAPNDGRAEATATVFRQ